MLTFGGGLYSGGAYIRDFTVYHHNHHHDLIDYSLEKTVLYIFMIYLHWLRLKYFYRDLDMIFIFVIVGVF